MSVDTTNGIECFVDADFEGAYNKESHSQTGYVIEYVGCPILWALKLQQTIAFTEAEY